MNWDGDIEIPAEDLVYKTSTLDMIKALDITPNPMDWAYYEAEVNKGNPKYIITDSPVPVADYQWMMLIRRGKAVSNLNPDVLFSELKDLAEFSTFSKPFSDNRKLVLQFIEHFKEGSMSDFSDEKLDKIVQDHPITKTYARDFVKALENSIERNKGKILISEGKGTERSNKDKQFQEELNNLKRPKYNSLLSKTDGTFFMMDDTHGMTVDVLDYVFCKKCNNYKGKLRLNIYDHFGLDQGDVEKYATQNWGVYGWYVLQHYEGFNKSQYNPFITRATAVYEIGSGKKI